MRAMRTLVAAALLAAGTQAAAEYRGGTVTDGGTLKGRVELTGEVPVLPPQPVFKHRERCGDTVPDERLVVGKDGGLRNVVAFLADVRAGKPVPRGQPVRLDNIKCAFVPHVLSATVGQVVEIHNSDPFLHDAHAFLGSRTLFNVAIPKGRTVRRPLAYAGPVHINCNVRHTWMHAYLYVVEHPYHAVSGENGEFAITDVPPGTYTLQLWHELLGSSERQVTVAPGRTATIDVKWEGVAAATP